MPPGPETPTPTPNDPDDFLDANWRTAADINAPVLYDQDNDPDNPTRIPAQTLPPVTVRLTTPNNLNTPNQNTGTDNNANTEPVPRESRIGKLVVKLTQGQSREKRLQSTKERVERRQKLHEHLGDVADVRLAITRGEIKESKLPEQQRKQLREKIGKLPERPMSRKEVKKHQKEASKTQSALYRAAIKQDRENRRSYIHGDAKTHYSPRKSHSEKKRVRKDVTHRLREGMITPEAADTRLSLADTKVYKDRFSLKVKQRLLKRSQVHSVNVATQPRRSSIRARRIARLDRKIETIRDLRDRNRQGNTTETNPNNTPAQANQTTQLLPPVRVPDAARRPIIFPQGRNIDPASKPPTVEVSARPPRVIVQGPNKGAPWHIPDKKPDKNKDSVILPISDVDIRSVLSNPKLVLEAREDMKRAAREEAAKSGGNLTKKEIDGLLLKHKTEAFAKHFKVRGIALIGNKQVRVPVDVFSEFQRLWNMDQQELEDLANPSRP